MTLLSTIDSEAFYQRVCASNADCVNNRFLSKHCPPIILREPKLLGLRGLARASIYDVRKIFGFFYPPPVTVTNQLILFFSSPFWRPPLPPTQCGCHRWKPPKTTPERGGTRHANRMIAMPPRRHHVHFPRLLWRGTDRSLM